MSAPKKKCRTCGGYCGKRKGQRCQHAANEAKRQADALWDFLKPAAVKQEGGA